MENISVKVVEISEYNGEARSFSKSVNFDIPEVFDYKGWDDKVGCSFYAEVNRNSKEFVKYIKDAINTFEQVNDSFPLDAISYNSFKIREYIASLEVKR